MKKHDIHAVVGLMAMAVILASISARAGGQGLGTTATDAQVIRRNPLFQTSLLAVTLRGV